MTEWRDWLGARLTGRKPVPHGGRERAPHGGATEPAR
jgi:hypothetical protein